ncbi:hypothetical protein [Paraburkholderia nemoris]
MRKSSGETKKRELRPNRFGNDDFRRSLTSNAVSNSQTTAKSIR